ncbi:Flp family type IVb pilin [Advenella alkanexedens]|uniref:Flp family type IVb pilin n=1 Tax=Advenella alkanexedens TaxID=1481665 RepID=A0ABS6NLZ1_9BURK|nr:Flp family type IVb pilin [Advenella alkanexedens]MBV4396638.1 Flp family type IVb pilin [Advenella alkanexedens]
MKDQLVKFWKDEEGATAIEYALIAGLIAVTIIAALSVMGDEIRGLFEKIGEALKVANQKATEATPTTP